MYAEFCDSDIRQLDELQLYTAFIYTINTGFNVSRRQGAVCSQLKQQHGQLLSGFQSGGYFQVSPQPPFKVRLKRLLRIFEFDSLNIKRTNIFKSEYSLRSIYSNRTVIRL